MTDVIIPICSVIIYGYYITVSISMVDIIQYNIIEYCKIAFSHLYKLEKVSQNICKIK